MKLTDEQYKALEPFERQFTRMVKAGYITAMDSHSLDIVHGIYQDVAHLRYHLNKGCGNCVKDLMYSMGLIYLQDKEEREAKPKVAVKMPRQRKNKDNAV